MVSRMRLERPPSKPCVLPAWERSVQGKPAVRRSEFLSILSMTSPVGECLRRSVCQRTSRRARQWRLGRTRRREWSGVRFDGVRAPDHRSLRRSRSRSASGPPCDSPQPSVGLDELPYHYPTQNSSPKRGFRSVSALEKRDREGAREPHLCHRVLDRVAARTVCRRVRCTGIASCTRRYRRHG